MLGESAGPKRLSLWQIKARNTAMPKNRTLATTRRFQENFMRFRVPVFAQPQLLAVALVAAMLPAFAQDAPKVAKPKAAGVPVTVTAEMTGAGIVSSGVAPLPIPPVTGSRKNPVASWGKPLPYPIVIADRRNNRLIEIAPDKSIVWEFVSPSLAVYRGNEDVNFSADGKLLAVSEEDNFDVHIVDYEKKALTWTFGIPDTRGKAPGLLNYPDDAHLLADGKFITADIRNCRILIVDPKTDQIATQWGTPGKCRHNPPHELAHPNGATPLENGDILVTEISDAWISRITREGKVLWSVKAPNIRYPSDAFMTNDGKQVIVADFWKPGRIVIFDPATRRVSWEYFVKEGEGMLDHSSIARELPDTGDIFVVDDLRDRVMVIDRKTKKVIWQYGVTDTKGHTPGLLFYPDGFDIDVFRDWKAALGKR
jgi:DNA-binding beta-propeller fold protein YncE